MVTFLGLVLAPLPHTIGDGGYLPHTIGGGGYLDEVLFFGGLFILPVIAWAVLRLTRRLEGDDNWDGDESDTANQKEPKTPET